MGAFKAQTTIEELMDSGIISVHLYNCLKTAGFDDFNSIFEFRKRNGLLSFLNLKNFGRKALSELEELFSGCYVPKAPIHPTTEGMVQVFEPFYASHAKQSEVFSRIYPSAAAFCQAVNDTTEMPHFKKEKLKYDEVTELWQIISSIITEVLESERVKKLSASQRRHLMRLSRTFILQMERNRFQLIYENVKSNPLIQQLMENEYLRLHGTVSVRTRNILASRLPEFNDALEQYFRGGLATRLLPSCGKKSVAEINTLLREFFNFAYDLMQKDIDDIEHTMIVSSYPFLDSGQVNFVQRYKALHRHSPMLYILYHYLLTADTRFEKFFRSVHGIGCRAKSLSETAEESGLSFERVRQVLTSGGIDHAMANDKEWQNYTRLLSARCFSGKSEAFEAARTAEGLAEMDFLTFGTIVSVIGGYTTVKIGDGCVFVKSDIAKRYRIKVALRSVCQASKRRYTATTAIPATSFFDFDIESLDEKQRKMAITTLAESAALLCGISADNRGYFIFSKNAINVTDTLYGILDREGCPMHINDIFSRFKGTYPDHRFTRPSQLRPYLLSSSRIKPIGKSSKFTIDKWKGVYTGTIRQLIHTIIDGSETPVNCHDLLTAVSEYFPKTNYNSVTTMVISDSRYCRYGKSTVGIKGRHYDGFKPSSQSDWKKLSFDERLAQLEEFLQERHHLPSAAGDEKEVTLMRWRSNVNGHRLSISDAQMDAYNCVLARHPESLCTRSEHEFRTKCDALKDFARQNRRLPSRHEDIRLYNWITGLKREHKFTGIRAELLSDLLSFLREYDIVQI